MTEGDERRLHTAGATVRHTSPFAHLDVPARHDNPDRAFIAKWVQPFYLQNLVDSAPFVEAMRRAAPEPTEEIIAELLSYLNWRPRIVGAYFVATKRLTSFEDQIGRLLLRSDVRYAGAAYCAALARFNSPASVGFLAQYLRYYLSRVDLWFDQGAAMAAMGWLDQQNGTTLRDEFEPQWQRFVDDKPAWRLGDHDGRFHATMNTIEAAARSAG